jgi:hypothetical protein
VLVVAESWFVSQSTVAVAKARGEVWKEEEGNVCRWKPLSADW